MREGFQLVSAFTGSAHSRSLPVRQPGRPSAACQMLDSNVDVRWSKWTIGPDVLGIFASLSVAVCLSLASVTSRSRARNQQRLLSTSFQSLWSGCECAALQAGMDLASGQMQ